MREAFIALDRNWRVIHVDDTAERILGRGREDLLGRSIWDVFPAMRMTRAESICRRTMDQRETVTFEEYYPALDAWFEGEVCPAADGLTIRASDITDRKRVEEALRRSEERFRTCFELGLIGMAITSPDKGILEVNGEICRILGYERSELMQTTWAQLTHPEDLAADIDRFNRVLAGELDCYSMDKRWIRKDGEVAYATISVKCLRRADGSVDYFVALLQDITHRKRIEDELRERERFLRQIAELTPAVLTVLDLSTGRHTYMSRDVVNLHGYTLEEIAQMKEVSLDLLHPDDLARMLENFARLKSCTDREINEIEYRIRHRDKSWRWLLSRNMPFARAQDGEVRQVVSATLDITARKQAEQSLRSSEERLRLLIESAEDYAIVTLDSDGRLNGWSRGAERLFGYGEHEVVGRLEEILFTPEDRARGVPVEEIRRALQEGRVAYGRYFLRKDDSRFFGAGVIAILRDHGMQGFARITRDLTERHEAADALRLAHSQLELRVLERTSQLAALNARLIEEIEDRKRTESKLRRSEADLAQAQRLSGTGSGSWNVNTGEVVWSQESYRIYGFEPGKVAPSAELFFGIVHPDDRPAVEQNFNRVVSERTAYALTFRIIRPDGLIKNIYSAGHPLFNDAGELTEVLGTVVDITERVQAEEKLRKAHAELAHVTRAISLGELTASIAHEVNQPLAAVVTNAEACLRWLAAEPPHLPEVNDCVRRVVRDAHRASEVLSRIRAFLKRTPPRRALLNVNELISDVVGIVHAQARSLGVSISIDLSTDLPPIYADRIELQQVVLNLSINAIEAMSAVTDRPRLLEIGTDREGPDSIRVTVRDSGVGLEAASKERIFDAFYTTKPEGLGMGLAISRSIIEAHGGRLWVTPSEDYGETFRFSLPIEME